MQKSRHGDLRRFQSRAGGNQITFYSQLRQFRLGDGTQFAMDDLTLLL